MEIFQNIKSISLSVQKIYYVGYRYFIDSHIKIFQQQKLQVFNQQIQVFHQYMQGHAL